MVSVPRIPENGDIVRTMTTILAIVPARNRKETTLRCLRSIESLALPDGVHLEVLVIDDGSGDGTGEAIRRHHPSTILERADGNLFWSGAIQRGLRIFRERDYEYAWLLNDDVEVMPDCLERLLAAVEKYPGRVYSGTTVDEAGTIIYGGIIRLSGFRFRKTEESDFENGIAFTDTLNGNCALLTRHAVAMFDVPPSGTYIHEGFDMFLGLEASRLGIGPVAIRNAICKGQRNPRKLWYYSRSEPLLERVKGVLGPKGVYPRMYWDLCRRFSGRMFFVYFLRPYILAVVGRDVVRADDASSR